jgi:uncharacterized protein
VSTNPSPDDVTVSGLFSYPIKGCRAVAHELASFTITGVTHDRECMLVDPRHNPQRFITQREVPLLATIGVRVLTAGAIELSREGAQPLVVRADTSPTALRKVKVWSSEVFAHDAGDEACQWFSDALGIASSQIRLVRFNLDHPRLCNPHYAGNSGAHTLFADGYPVLITNEASLADLNLRMGRNDTNALPMNRFRPNLVLRGLPAWDEDFIDEITIPNADAGGDIVFKLVKPCVRCEVTTTDQASGTRLSEEPLNTLARFRNNPDFGGVTFGWNAIVVNGGSVAIGAKAAASYRFE